MKFALNDVASFEDLASSLSIQLATPMTQIDQIFLLNGTDFDDLERGFPVVRIREVAVDVTITVKKYVDGIQDRREANLSVSDAQNATELLELLGFSKVVCVQKTRKKGLFGEVTLCLDHVHNLGSFVELEVTCDDSQVDAALESILEAASSLGLSRSSIVKEPYDKMLYEQVSR